MNTSRIRTLLALALALLLVEPARAQAPAAAEPPPFKLGVVTFLSGAAAGPFGVPARNGAEVLVEAINGGKMPAPYATKGFGGRPVQLVFLDEAGGTTKQVSEYRDLVQRQNVDAVIGYISSGDCLAVAPVAEELKKLTDLLRLRHARASSRTPPTSTCSAPRATRRWTTWRPRST